jgi:hypothetical protein
VSVQGLSLDNQQGILTDTKLMCPIKTLCPDNITFFLHDEKKFNFALLTITWSIVKFCSIQALCLHKHVLLAKRGLPVALKGHWL